MNNIFHCTKNTQIEMKFAHTLDNPQHVCICGSETGRRFTVANTHTTVSALSRGVCHLQCCYCNSTVSDPRNAIHHTQIFILMKEFTDNYFCNIGILRVAALLFSYNGAQ